MRCRARFSILVVLALAAGSAFSQPTKLPVPAGAKDVHEITLWGGGAHETYFTMDVDYPATPALDHYKKVIKQPWVQCSWMPNWQSYLDGTVKPVRKIFQQATVWINRDAKREIMVASRYSSAKDCGDTPDNNKQQVTVIEYMNIDLDSVVSGLKLECGTPAMRSNHTPHAAARDAANDLNQPAARAGGRER